MADSGETVTYAELDDRSMQLARRLRAHGLRPGDRVAVLLENNPRYFEVFWATARSGLYFAPMNWHLDIAETAEMVEDSAASVLVTSVGLADTAVGLGPRRTAGVTLRLLTGGDLVGFTNYEDALASQPARPPDEEPEGNVMFYSSGTTGRPKTIVPPLSGATFGERPNLLAALFQVRWGFGPDMVFLCPGPLYHAGPTGFSQTVHRLGGTVVVMEEFDAARTLELIEQHRVTHAWFVPMHFRQLLALDEIARSKHDLSSLRFAMHGTAPCPVTVKEQMIDWWGPVVHEYYVGSEGSAFTLVGPEDWLEHKGTVGKLLSGAVHILDADGAEVPAGEQGQIWFEGSAPFEYHNDPEATRQVFNDRGWTTLGDIGHVDEDGWLYVDDRLCDVIVNEGRAVLPLQIEQLLALHPAVADAAVIGVADPACGERVTAVVEARTGVITGDVLARELLQHCRRHLDPDICPASVEFVDTLGRLPTGKLLKRELKRRIEHAARRPGPRAV